ncbi:hypothetical protein HJC23_004931 [Cyclotella cryptica]|uniref:J domain-containing protein n=1 Tax=Cyclotella cryptica TaxID=29204 RepID=A0ABD3PTL0_9STRA|eukprot:CCRYP_011894-RA/>CCRYP_011894-RA protein AED:0.43 eAED:0.43 QI:0/-1/0/1/-1/1/1/0/458
MTDDTNTTDTTTTTTPQPPTDPAEEWEIQRDQLKSQADAHFRSHSYAQAIADYSSALQLDPTNHILLSNQSAAHLAHGEKSKALQTARKCVECAPSGWVKGYTRLAAAMASLGRYAEAAEVYSRVLGEMDGENVVARRGLEECRARERGVSERRREEAEMVQRELDRQRAEREEGLRDGGSGKDGREKKEEEEEEGKKKQTNDGASCEEDDLLDDFFSEVENVTEKPKHQDVESTTSDNNPDEESKNNRIKIHLNDLGTSASQINRLLQTNYEWKNLNPYYVLDIPHTIDDDESIISARYRALSLLVHPDKNPDDADRAKAAFEQVRKAMNQMNDDVKRKHIRALIEQGHKQGKRDWEETKRKDASSSTTMDPEKDRQGLLAAQSKATMKIFAEIEAKRRDVERRKRKFEQRERAQEDEEKTKEKNEREHDMRWREMGRVEKRVGNWRDFQMGGSKKK